MVQATLAGIVATAASTGILGQNPIYENGERGKIYEEHLTRMYGKVEFGNPQNRPRQTETMRFDRERGVWLPIGARA